MDAQTIYNNLSTVSFKGAFKMECHRVITLEQIQRIMVQWYGEINVVGKEGKLAQLGVGVTIEALKEHAFQNGRESRQQDAVKEFMDSVERLGAEIDDLRNSIPQ